MGPAWVLLGFLLAPPILEALGAVLGRLGRLLGASLDVLGAFWDVLGASWGVLRTLCGKTFEKPSISPPKIEPRTLENQAPTAARAWFERFSDFRNEPSIWNDLGANLPAFWLHFPSPGASWGPLGASWKRPGGVLGASWGHLGASCGVLGRLGASWRRLGALFGPTWGLSEASWGLLEAARGLLGPTDPF